MLYWQFYSIVIVKGTVLESLSKQFVDWMWVLNQQFRGLHEMKFLKTFNCASKIFETLELYWILSVVKYSPTHIIKKVNPSNFYQELPQREIFRLLVSCTVEELLIKLYLSKVNSKINILKEKARFFTKKSSLNCLSIGNYWKKSFREKRVQSFRTVYILEICVPILMPNFAWASLHLLSHCCIFLQRYMKRHQQ